MKCRYCCTYNNVTNYITHIRIYIDFADVTACKYEQTDFMP